MGDPTGDQFVGPYRVIDELGRGNFGVVLLAQREDGERVAVKVLLSSAMQDPEMVARFEREVHLMRSLRHPGVVEVFDVGRDRGRLYFAMELVEGETLRTRLRRESPLPIREAVELVCSLANALHHAHERGVIHRDVKPANVILDARTGLPRLTDFGLARHQWISNLTQSGDVLGTPSYMAPEQFRTARVDARADIYALGVILYKALTGKVPFLADSFVEQEELVSSGSYRPLRQLRAEIPSTLAKVVENALARDPNDRYRSARDLEDDLTEFLSAEPEDDEPQAISPRVWVRRRRLGVPRRRGRHRGDRAERRSRARSATAASRGRTARAASRTGRAGGAGADSRRRAQRSLRRRLKPASPTRHFSNASNAVAWSLRRWQRPRRSSPTGADGSRTPFATPNPSRAFRGAPRERPGSSRAWR